jgi:hypothetical protein
MASVSPTVSQIVGETQGPGSTSLLDVVSIFKGKLRAAATFHDSADLRWLKSSSPLDRESNFNNLIKVECILFLPATT